MPKLLDLQILRAIAASLVVVDHGFLALSHEKLDASRFIVPGWMLGHLGVCAFFVLSGLLMVRQSANLFAVKGGPFLFFYRRVTRIVPMYWIALLLWAWKHPAGPQQLILSLLFLPNYLSGDERLSPLLQPGWTLNYEMAFYLLFALALFLPRRRGIVLVLVILEGLVALGRSHNFPTPASPAAMLNFYTQPFMMLFAHGVLIGFVELEIRSFKRFSFPISPSFLLLIPAIACLASPGYIGKAGIWELLSFYGVLVVLLCTVGSSNASGRVGRALVLLGDASYCTYLFHLWITSTIARWTVRIRGTGHMGTGLLFAEIAICILLANVAGLIVHLLVERRITRALKRVRFGFLRNLQSRPA